jgi:hypothetical protein
MNAIARASICTAIWVSDPDLFWQRSFKRLYRNFCSYVPKIYSLTSGSGHIARTWNTELSHFLIIIETIKLKIVNLGFKQIFSLFLSCVLDNHYFQNWTIVFDKCVNNTIFLFSFIYRLLKVKRLRVGKIRAKCEHAIELPWSYARLWLKACLVFSVYTSINIHTISQ